MSSALRGSQVLWGDSSNNAAVVYSGTYAAPATLDDGPVSATGHLTFTAVSAGAAGNNIQIWLFNDAAADPPTVDAVSGTGTSGDPYVIKIHFKAATSTAKNIADVVNADVANSALYVAATYASTGAGKPVASAATNLAGGYDAGVTGHPTASSSGANLGTQTEFALFIETDAAATFRIQAAANVIPSAGRNTIPAVDGSAESSWYSFVRADAVEFEAGVAVVADFADEVIFGAAGALCIDFSPFAPTFMRLIRVDNNAGAVNVKAHVVSVG